MNDLIASAPLPESAPLASLMSQSAKLRGAHWDALVRVVLSVRSPDDLDAQGEVTWDRVTPRDLDAPVTEDAVRAWLSTKPPRSAVRHLGWLFDVRDPRAVTREALVRMAAELHPDALVELLGGSPSRDPIELPLYAVAGEAFGAACARQLVATPYAGFSSAMGVCADAACAAYLRGAASVMNPHELGQTALRIFQRPTVSDDTRVAYGEALVTVVAKLTNKSAREIYLYTRLLDAKHIEAALRASTKRPKVFSRLVLLAASQGTAQGASALAALLDDKKLAGHAAAALASMGTAGAKAAATWLDAQPSKTTRGATLARTLAAIPSTEQSLWAGDLRALPRFGRDPREDLRTAAPSEAPLRERTPLATIEAALTEPPAEDLLSPDGWADLLQLIAIDPWLNNVSYAWRRANARGLLGRGNDPAAMMSALDAIRWDCAVTRSASPHNWGIGHVLLWAGAGRDVYQHAIARFELSNVLDYLGSREQQFAKALDLVRPRWAQSIQCLLRHYGSNRNETAWLGAPPVLAELTAPGASVELAAPTADLWITGTVEGATRFTLRFRGDVTVTVDVAAERWEVSGAVSASGATPPLDAARGVRFAVETARDLMYLGIDGAIVNGAISKLPSKVAPVAVTAEGDGAAVTSLTLRAKYTVRACEAAATLFDDLDNAQGYTEVAGLQTPAAAHCLAACALLLDEAQASNAKAALLTMKGDGLDAWKDLARDGVALAALEEEPAPAKTKGRKKKSEPAETPSEKAPEKVTPAPVAEVLAPTEFTVRSFEDVVRAFHDARPGVKAKSKKPAVFKRGQIARGDLEYATFSPKPETEDWSARTAVPWPALYLGDEAPSFDEPKYFIDAVADLPALCQKGRGTRAEVSCALVEGSYIVVEMSVQPPENGYDDWNEWYIVAASWKVDEGWATAIMEGRPDALLPYIGMRALPAQVEWTKFSYPVGNW